jgi:CubicO group peptidase (beta-lactamase class C family)
MSIRVDESMIHGSVAPGFEKVRDAFVKNFSERQELGAACAAYLQGEKVVDLWGGYRNGKTRQPWLEDTLVLVFSTTKGISGLACAIAHSRGYFDYDEPVSTYWPEFAQGGKEDITVRQLLSHQAGLCAIDEPMDLETLADPDRVAATIAKQKPAWEPCARHGYHALTLGWYESELVRRTDPQHRTMGKFLQDEVASPLGLEIYIGLPGEVPDARVADIYAPAYKLRMVFNIGKLPRDFVKAFLKKGTITNRSFTNPKVLGSPTNYNRRDMRSIELPAANGIVQVRDVARLYGIFATGGAELGIKPETLEAIMKPAQDPAEGRYDQVLHLQSRFSLGFLKPFDELRFGTSDKAFGTPGAGGSFAYADPDTGTGFAYAMNRSGFYVFGDPRETVLSDAFFECIGKP